MSSTLDTVRDALQVALLPKLTAIEKDLQALCAEVAEDNQALRNEAAQTNQELRAEMHQNNLELRGEMKDLRADLEMKFSILVNEVQKIGIRTDLTFDRI
jgi:hypothetical protein